MKDQEENQGKESVFFLEKWEWFQPWHKKTENKIQVKNIALICKDEIDFSCDQCAKRFEIKSRLKGYI